MGDQEDDLRETWCEVVERGEGGGGGYLHIRKSQQLQGSWRLVNGVPVRAGGGYEEVRTLGAKTQPDPLTHP